MPKHPPIESPYGISFLDQNDLDRPRAQHPRHPFYAHGCHHEAAQAGLRGAGHGGTRIPSIYPDGAGDRAPGGHDLYAIPRTAISARSCLPAIWGARSPRICGLATLSLPKPSPRSTSPFWSGPGWGSAILACAKRSSRACITPERRRPVSLCDGESFREGLAGRSWRVRPKGQARARQVATRGGKDVLGSLAPRIAVLLDFTAILPIVGRCPLLSRSRRCR